MGRFAGYLRFLIIPLMVAPTLLAGCTWKRVPKAVLNTPGVRIVDDRGAFDINPGVEVVPPVSNVPTYCPDVESYTIAEARGARRVTIWLADWPQPLYGILDFLSVPSATKGAVARSMLLQVPPEYVEATSGGRISMVYEPSGVTVKLGGVECESPAWVLWLSREPLPVRL